MRVVAAVQQWPGQNGGFVAPAQTADAVAQAWTGAAPHVDMSVYRVGDGGPRSADAVVGERFPVGGAEAVAITDGYLLSPTGGLARWNPADLATALLGLAADAAAQGQRRTVVVPLGDSTPAGDALHLWGGGLPAMRKALASLTIVALVGADRPLLGFHGMSSALRDGRENDPAIGKAAQEQEERWGTIALEADPLAPTGALVGPARLSDAPGSGAAGGLAYCLGAAGARLMPASAFLLELSGFTRATDAADVVVGVVGDLTPRGLDYGAAQPVAHAAARHAIPCVVVTPALHVGRRDLMAAGISSAYEAGAGEDALGGQVRRIAHTWTPLA